MSSIVTGILSSTVGLLCNKARDATAKNLKDGDITDAKIREIFVRELDDVKTKLDGLSRKDLLSSYSFLQEGVQLLNASLDKTKDEQKSVVKENEDDRGPSGAESDILNEALELSHAMGKLKLASNEFVSAKKRFEDARKKATDAFWTQSLDIQDRIFAAKLRVVSEMLEWLESPKTAVTSCVLFLKKLHDLPAVRERFSVYLDGGVKSFWNKAERVENVKSVMMINYVLYQFTSKFSSKYHSVLNWPTIQLSDRSFNPIFNWQEVSTGQSWGEDFVQPPNVVESDEQLWGQYMAVNSRGEILVAFFKQIHVIYKTGESKEVWKISASTEGTKNVNEQTIAGLAVDQENNVYVVVYFEKTSETSVILYVLDEHCLHVKHTSQLNFLPDMDNILSLSLAINKNNNIVMVPNNEKDPHVYVCDQTGQLKYKFAHSHSYTRLCCASLSDNEIMLTRILGDSLEIYTEEGNIQAEWKLVGHQVRGAAFHFATSEIIILTYGMKEKCYCLHRCTETGEIETSMPFSNIQRAIKNPITSHPSGPVAILEHVNTITFI